MYRLTVKSHFDAAHKLVGYPGACANLHGHTFYYAVELSGEKLDQLGMLIDFSKIKIIMKNQVEAIFDHKFLNEVPSFTVLNPTAEQLARIIHDIIDTIVNAKTSLRQYNIKVTVWESPECSVEYSL